MTQSNNEKFYRFLEILKKYSDEENILNIEEINNLLKEEYGFTIERKALYRYIKTIKVIGFDISDYNENKKGYYIREQMLEEHEIKILLDCIAASKSLTQKKTDELSKKLSKLNTKYVEYSLKYQTYISNRAKCKNEEIFINIDKIISAINGKKKIAYKYCDYNEKKELVTKKNKEGEERIYVANPIAMIFKDDYYYLIQNIDGFDNLSNYRIDRIKDINVKEEDRKSLSEIKNCGEQFDPSIYAKRCIKMFGDNNITEIKLEVRNYVLNFIIDELGDEVKIEPKNDKWNTVTFKCISGSGLVKWLLQLGKDVKVIEPKELKDEMIKEINDIIKLYE